MNGTEKANEKLPTCSRPGSHTGRNAMMATRYRTAATPFEYPPARPLVEAPAECHDRSFMDVAIGVSQPSGGAASDPAAGAAPPGPSPPERSLTQQCHPLD